MLFVYIENTVVFFYCMWYNIFTKKQFAQTDKGCTNSLTGKQGVRHGVPGSETGRLSVQARGGYQYEDYRNRKEHYHQ